MECILRTTKEMILTTGTEREHRVVAVVDFFLRHQKAESEEKL